MIRRSIFFFNLFRVMHIFSHHQLDTPPIKNIAKLFEPSRDNIVPSSYLHSVTPGPGPPFFYYYF